MKAAAISVFLSCLGGALLALVRVLAPVPFFEKSPSVSDLWVMGIVPIAMSTGTLVALGLSPLAIWAFRSWDRQDLSRAGVLLLVLAGYMAVSSIFFVWNGSEDRYGILTVIAPVGLTIVGLVFAGRLQTH